MAELRHLRYFVAVAEELNFSRAAERLHMAQPPLSVAIRQLEQEIGTSLFVRTSREVRLTQAGTTFLAGARRALAEADAAVTAAQRAAAGQLGSLRIAYNWSARFETLPALGQALRRSCPDVEILAEEMRPSRMPEALRAGTVDVAVALFPDIVAGLSYRLIRRERVVALLSSEHPLAAKGEVPLAALADECLLFPRELAPRLHDFYAGLGRKAGFEPRHSTESSRTRWTLGTWEASTAALLPHSVAGEVPDGTVALGISEPADRLQTELVWRNDDDNPVLAVFRGVAAGVFAVPGRGHGGRSRSPAAA